MSLIGTFVRPSVLRTVLKPRSISPVSVGLRLGLGSINIRCSGSLPKPPATNINPHNFVITPPTDEELGFFVSKLPAKFIPYARLSRWEKPIGTWLLYSPCTWAITMAAYSTAAPLTSTIWTLGLFGIGAFIMRGAGCTINDMLDRNLDNQVERTINRPIASGEVSVKQATAWLGTQCFMGLGVLLSLPSDCFLLGAASLPFVFTYPLFKRFTYYPQAMLSFCFNWGALLGFPAMGVWNWGVMVPLFTSAWTWCMTYDTIYAHQDKKFDVVAGIKSTALAWGKNTKTIMTALSITQISLLGFAGFMNSMGPCFWIGVGIGTYRLGHMIKNVNLDDPKSCWNSFTNNINTGHVFFYGILGDYLLKLMGYL